MIPQTALRLSGAIRIAYLRYAVEMPDYCAALVQASQSITPNL